ncbi:MAG: hypothetical protein K5649_01600 [Lachnospiraceae bacterium]|nr:hypothetical protein [Lachnospiraceae bacterium]
MKNKTKTRIFVFLLSLTLSCICFASPASAKPLDEIENYMIAVEVNENGSLDMTYHIDWKVLDSDSEGPLTWVQIGAPNKNHIDHVTALSDNIKNIRLDGSYFRIDLDRAYRAGETVSFEFTFTQDYLYQVNKLKEGYTVYTFTPGWFDDIEVDQLLVFWENDKIDSFSPEAEVQSDWNIWTAHLSPGQKYTITVSYPNDAYGFDLSHTEEEDGKDPWYVTLLAVLIVVIFGGSMLGGIIFVYVGLAYAASAGFSALGYGLNALSGGNKKVTRTKIEYYDACPGCGGTREQGKDVCAFCGKSMIKSSETITEKQLQNEYKDALKLKADGDYRIGKSGNSYIRVQTVPITFAAYRKSLASSSRSSGGRGGSHHSSCAHSSCACACACACAGGGRAGCTNKDFHKTGLKLHYFKV